jgi:hypothetical protein
MPIDRERARQCLRAFDFRRLFLDELGWDKYSAALPVSLGGAPLTLTGAAEKRGVVAFVCEEIPDYSSRLKIEKQVAKSHFEHFIIFADKARGRQVWQWVRREPGRPLRAREHRYETSQSGELLIQKLENVLVTLDQEESFTLSAVTHGLRAAFDVETVTKKFYERFKAEHERFLKFIEGIPDEHMESWYASVMMNRLMFLYFIQAKTFLDGNVDYLRTKLAESKGRGSNRYYRDFLCTLFFEGFAKRKEERAPAVNRLLGTVPYLNGGLFQRHQIEELHGRRIQIPDAAFDRLFDFFKEYQWHLDERPNRDDREIDPDVLGYIFEKYINQKQMGAYYTKEDITEYIGKNTIVPFLFDAAKKRCAVAFEPDGYVWRLVRENPDRYIYEAVRRGKDRTLPAEISAGLANVAKREEWNQSTPYEEEPENFLRTETWREFVERRQRYQEVRQKQTSGQVASINDFITLNLDIRQFAEDVIQYSEGPELVRAFYKAISAVSVLDPTCGSGAFLFAALNILKPLYEACLKRMDAFVEEWEAKPGKPSPEKFKDFREILQECRKHPNQDYFVLKSVIVNNLYGVDIMEEAIEICKLRLFLKLVAQVETQDRIEPLPDIDFNIRAGNTLVGYARYEHVQQAVASKLDFGGAMERIEDKAKILDSAVEMFRHQQTRLNGTVTAEDKQDLRRRFSELADELNDHLAGDYNKNTKKDIVAWKESHKPFHWFSEFHRIMLSGGFDVVIGNPPYLEKSKLNQPIPKGPLKTLPCPDVYAWVVERSVALQKSGGRAGLIVPVSIAAADAFRPLRDVLWEQRPTMWLSHFANRPGQLFTGGQNRLTILIVEANSAVVEAHSTRYHRWNAKEGERDCLLQKLCYSEVTSFLDRLDRTIPKIGSAVCSSVMQKILRDKALGHQLVKSSEFPVYWVRVPGYFCQYYLDPPMARPEKGGAPRRRGELLAVYSSDQNEQRIAHAVLNSSTFYLYFCATTDGRHINPSDVRLFPFDASRADAKVRHGLEEASKRVAESFKRHTSYVRKSGLLIDSVAVEKAKPTIDIVDSVIAQHYGFTDEELDFVVHYDIKYRVGEDGGEE